LTHTLKPQCQSAASPHLGLGDRHSAYRPGDASRERGPDSGACARFPVRIELLSATREQEASPDTQFLERAEAVFHRHPDITGITIFFSDLNGVSRGKRLPRESLAKALKSNAVVAVIDWKINSPKGPPPKHRVEPGVLIQEMERAGYRKIGERNFLPHQYFLLFEPLS